MVVNVAIPHRLKWKMIPAFHAVLFPEHKDIH